MKQNDEFSLKNKKQFLEDQEHSDKANTLLIKEGVNYYIEAKPVKTWWKKPKTVIKETNRCPFCRKILPVHSLIGEVVVYCRHCKSEVKLSVLLVSPSEMNDQMYQSEGEDEL